MAGRDLFAEEKPKGRNLFADQPASPYMPPREPTGQPVYGGETNTAIDIAKGIAHGAPSYFTAMPSLSMAAGSLPGDAITWLNENLHGGKPMLPDAVGDFLVKATGGAQNEPYVTGAYNAITRPATTLNQGVEAILNKIGIGSPETTAGRISRDITSGGAGGLGSARAGASILSTAKSGSRISALGNILAAAPKSQALAGASSGLAAGSTREMGGSPTAQFLAGLAGGIVAPMALPKRIGGTNISIPANKGTEYGNQVDILEALGIPLTGGQKSGKNWLKATETTLADMPVLGTPMQNVLEAQRKVAQSEVFKHGGATAGENMLTRETLDNMGKNLSARYSKVLGDKKLDLNDPQFLDDLEQVRLENTGYLAPEESAGVNAIIEKTKDKAFTDGAMTGEKYQQTRSSLGKKTGHQDYGQLYAGIKKAYDDLFARTVGGDKFAIDKAYQIKKTLEDIYKSGGGSAASEGFVPFASLSRAGGKLPNREFESLTKALSSVMGDRVGNSGTASRSHIIDMLKGGGLASAAWFAPVSTAMAAGNMRLASELLSRGMTLPSGKGLLESTKTSLFPALLSTNNAQNR